MKINVKIRLEPILFILVIFILLVPSVQSFCLPIIIYGNLGGGIGIIESTISGFYLKTMPVITSGVTIASNKPNRINLGLNLDVLYSFKSDYNDYFYYSPFTEIDISPFVEIKLLKFLILGVSTTFAPTYTAYESTIDFKIGGYLMIPIKSKWLKSINLKYDHGFFEGYKANERITLNTRILIYKKD